MKFKSRENTCHTTTDGKEIWNSRSVAVVGMIIMLHKGEKYVILGKRGPSSPNEVDKWCLPCGYLDWDETCEEAVVREIWEESGFNVLEAIEQYDVIHNQMHYPWKINSNPELALQNVSMHYALYLDSKANMFRDVAALPELTFENNAIEGEVSEVKWVNVNDLYKYECAFNHDSTIKVYVNNLPKSVE